MCARRAECEALANARQAQEESQHATAINAFLNDDLLGAVSPESQGFDVPMRRVLDVAASKLEGRFTERSRTERSIRPTLGRTHRSLALHHDDQQYAHVVVGDLHFPVVRTPASPTANVLS